MRYVFALYCIVLYCIVLYCIVLYCIVLYCIVLYCIGRTFCSAILYKFSVRFTSIVRDEEIVRNMCTCEERWAEESL